MRPGGNCGIRPVARPKRYTYPLFLRAFAMQLDRRVIKEAALSTAIAKEKRIASPWQCPDITVGALSACRCLDPLEKGIVMRRRWWLAAAAITPLVASALAGSGPAAQAGGTQRAVQAASTSTGPGPAGGPTGLAVGYPFCQHLGKSYQASSAAQIACFGAHKVSKIQPAVVGPAAAGAPRNVDAASFREDVAPNGTRAFGQSETSIAAAGPYVVEAWNDSTSFFSKCGSNHFKEEVTGIGFSANGGRSFTDLGGLPNPGCGVRFYAGDPSVVAYRVGGRTFFYVFSLYLPTRFNGQTHVAFDPCEVIGAGSAARLHCGRPVVAASSTQCLRFG